MSTINAVGNGLSGATGTGNFVGATSPTLVTPTIGAATATSVTFSPTTGGIVGTTTNDNAAAGKVGEFVSSNIPFASAVTATSNANSDLTSISLTAGDWDVWGNVLFPSTGLGVTQFKGWINTTSATSPDISLTSILIATGLGNNNGFTVPQQRLSLSTTTTAYISVLLSNTNTNGTVCGGIYARRVR